MTSAWRRHDPDEIFVPVPCLADEDQIGVCMRPPGNFGSRSISGPLSASMPSCSGACRLSCRDRSCGNRKSAAFHGERFGGLPAPKQHLGVRMPTRQIGSRYAGALRHPFTDDVDERRIAGLCAGKHCFNNRRREQKADLLVGHIARLHSDVPARRLRRRRQNIAADARSSVAGHGLGEVEEAPARLFAEIVKRPHQIDRFLRGKHVRRRLPGRF